jgi:hypothetical protein
MALLSNQMCQEQRKIAQVGTYICTYPSRLNQTAERLSDHGLIGLFQIRAYPKNGYNWTREVNK